MSRRCYHGSALVVFAVDGAGEPRSVIMVCRGCGRIRERVVKFDMVLWLDWSPQRRERYPDGAHFRIVAGPSGDERRLRDAAEESIASHWQAREAVSS